MATNKQLTEVRDDRLYAAFLFNLNCYEEGTIDKDDFINAMEEYIYE